MKKKLLAFFLSIALVLSTPISAFADVGGADSGSADDKNAAVNEEIDASALDSSVWTSEDFTYGSYSKELYGCDYSREITVEGTAITGFSEQGEAKLAENTDLVIPAQDADGNNIVGVAESAFYDKGLTSVTFPTGMMVPYDDTLTHRVTKRGNFVIAENAFAKNELTKVVLPEGVLAVLPSAFNMNKIETVKLPRTIWWLENMAFANNRIVTVNFPTTCDFQLEMHGMTFAKNFIKSVRLPDFTEVVNKTVFVWNTGSESLAENVENEKYKTYEIDGKTYDAGVVYMYTDNAELEGKDRIHHAGKATASQHSDVQKLIVNDGSEETQNPDQPWTIDDFTVEGTVVTGLSESGVAKRAENKNLVIPDMNKDYEYITEIAAAPAGETGLFATETEKFDTVELPNELEKIGNFAFQNNGLDEVQLPARLKEIGISAFQTNDLTSVILPDTVTVLGGGAFGTNPKLERISLSTGLAEIPAGAFGCSDQKNYMTGLTSIDIPEGITSIGNNAFSGNNFREITLPSTVKTIGNYAFSTKNYLTEPCRVTLNEGLETIGNRAFRNKVIAEITMPATVTKIGAQTFEKEYSDETAVVQTKVYLPLKSQYDDKKNFPSNDYQKMILKDASVWTSEDFTYGTQSFALYPAADYSPVENFTGIYVITGLSESGLKKIESNKAVTLPAVDPDGKKVQGVGEAALKNMGIVALTLPETESVALDKEWTPSDETITTRGDFFIGASAFYGNQLTTMEIPEGVIYIGNNAFGKNSLTAVKFPKTLMQISNQAFARNQITSLSFTEKTEYPFQVDAMAFGSNQIKSVQLPANTEKLDTNAFAANPGADGTSKVVDVYINTSDLGSFVATNSKFHKIIQQEIPPAEAPWGINDFTYDESGTAITGLSEAGKEKIKVNGALILPKEGPSGAAITALGNGTAMKGIFMYSEGEKNYAPTSVILPSTLKSIGNFTFASNPKLKYEMEEMTTIVLPEGLESIGQTAFQQSPITSVSIPDSVTSLGTAAFVGSALTSVKISNSLKEIPANAFSGQDDRKMEIENLVIPEGVESIGSRAFAGAHVHNLKLPSTLTKIGANAFENHQLTSLVIPEKVTDIGNYAFRMRQDGWDKTLESLTLNEGLLSIGKEAFSGSMLTEADLPSTVTTLADTAFKDGENGIVKLYTSNKEQVENFNTEKANASSHKVIYDKLIGTGWNSEDFTYDEATGTLTGWSESGQAKRKTLKTLVLPDVTPGGKDIEAVGDEAFKIPDSEVTVTKFGIDSPNGMTSVDMPEKLKRVGKESFAQNALKEVDLTGLTAIGESAFYGNKLASVSIPDTVTELGAGAFATNDITELKLSANVTKIPQGAFSMNIRLEQITIPDTVTEIGEMAFAGARLTSLTIPKSVVKIERKAFHLHHLTELVIPGNVKEIGESAFEGTYKATTLNKLVIEEGVENIGKYAFKEALLETVHFPDSIKTVGIQPFLNNMGKDGSHVVEVTTNNKAHLAFGDDTYQVKYIGIYDIAEYADKVKLAFDSVEYTGSAVEPQVTIEGLKEDVDYTVEYKNNIEPGEATVVITGIGDYTGTIEKTFNITAKKPDVNPPDKDDPANHPAGDGADSENTPQGGDKTAGSKTGDNSHVYFWLVMMMISGSAFAGTKVYRKRKTDIK